MHASFFAILTLLCAAPLRAQETRATIHGVVSDSLGRQLAGVTVRVDGASVGIETDAAGAFRVPVLAHGVYRISFHLAGFVPRTFRVWIREGYQGEYDLGQVMLNRFGEGVVTLTGTVRDSTTGEPVPAVTIGLDERVAALTGRDGTFLVDNVRLGTVHLEARRIGYAPLAVDLDIIEGETFDFDIDVTPLALALEDIEVTVDENFSSYGPLRGLMRRRQRGIGYSFLRHEIDEERPLYITDLLRTLPSVQVRYNQFGEATIAFRGCSPTTYINGIQLGSVADINWLVHPDNVEAMEVHLGAYTPAEYRNYNACGVIAIWTR